MTRAARPRLVTPAFLALAVATLVFFIAGGIILPAAPRFARDGLGADAVGVGISIAAFSIAALVLRPFVGWVADRFGRRPLLIGGSLITVAGLALHLAVTDLPLFIVARALLGAGEGFFLVAALSAGSDLAPPTRRGEAISLLSLSLYLGIAIGPPIGETVFREAGFDGVWIAAILLAVAATILACLTPESAPAVVGGSEKRARPPLIHPAGLFIGLVVLFGFWGMAGYFTFLPLYGPEVGLPDVAPPLALYGIVVVILRIIGASWPDRFGAARLSGAALALSAVGLAIIGLVPTAAGVIGGTVVYAAGVAFTLPALLALAVSRVPETERGSVVGTTTLFLDISFGAAPVGLGFVAAAAGYAPTFIVSAVLAALASVLLIAGRATLTRPVVA